MRQWAPVLVIVAVFLALGFNNLPGWKGTGEAAQRVQAKLDGLPTTLGPWQSEPLPISEKVLRIAEAQAHVSRVYRLGPDHEPISVLVFCGAPGPMGAHTPEVCYAGLGYRQAGKSQKIAIPGEPGSQLWVATFEKENSPGLPLEVVWGHGVGGRWIASDSPRLDFAGNDLIFKVYVSRNKLRESSGPDTLPEFLERFFREFRSAFPSSAD